MAQTDLETGTDSALEPLLEASAPAEPVAEMPLPDDPKTIFLGGLFALALLASAYVAGEIVLPLVFAFTLKLLLQPLQRLLEGLHIPRMLAALLLILLLLGTIVAIGTAISGPAGHWAAKIPEGVPRLEERLSFVRAPINTLQQFLQQIDNAGTSGAHPDAVSPLAGSALITTLFAGTRSFASGLFTTVLFLYFLLMSGDTFLRRLIFLLAGLLTIDNLWQALLPAALYLAIHIVEGETVTPMLLARRFTLNPVLVILSLVFWFWMWGIPGAILSVPMLAIAKIVCDRVRPFAALGHFLEG